MCFGMALKPWNSSMAFKMLGQYKDEPRPAACPALQAAHASEVKTCPKQLLKPLELLISFLFLTREPCPSPEPSLSNIYLLAPPCTRPMHHTAQALQHAGPRPGAYARPHLQSVLAHIFSHLSPR